MNKLIENLRTMFEGVRAFFTEYRTKLLEVPAFADILTAFDARMAEMDSLAGETNKGTEGKTQTKHQAQAALIKVLVPLCSALYLLGRKRNDEALKAVGDTTRNKLAALRDTELKTKATVVLEAVTAHEADLAPFTIDAAKIADAQQKSAAFEKSIGDRENGAAYAKTSRKSLVQVAAEIDELLTEDADTLMEQLLEKYPDLYDEYFAVRQVKHAGIRHKQKIDPVPQPVTPVAAK
jgi:exonuclease VII small subunit